MAGNSWLQVSRRVRTGASRRATGSRSVSAHCRPCAPRRALETGLTRSGHTTPRKSPAPCNYRAPVARRATSTDILDFRVRVLDTGIGDHGGRRIAGRCTPIRFMEDCHRGRDREVLRDPPGKNFPGKNFTREVVDHCVQVHLRAIEQSDDRHVDVPELIGLRSRHSILWVCGVNPCAGPTPAPLANQPVPGRRRGEYATESLGKDGESAGRNMPVLWRLDHLLDGHDLRGGQPRGLRLRATHLVVEFTELLGPAPLMMARRRQMQDTQSTSERERTLSTLDGPEQPALRGPIGQPSAFEPNIERSQDSEQQSDNCAQYIDATLEGEDLSQTAPRPKGQALG